MTVTGNGVCNLSTATDNLILTINSSTITLIPSAASSSQDTCFNSPIKDIRYFIGGTATGATLTGLPTGLTSEYSIGIVKIGGVATQSGTFTYTVNSSGGCSAAPLTGTITIRSAIPAPIVSGDTTNCSELAIGAMRASVNVGGTLSWSDDATFSSDLGTGATLIPSSVLGSTLYYVRENLNGCFGESSAITITVKECDLATPTAITPDGDSKNDTWKLKNLDTDFPNNSVSIFNRWGQKIYESPKGDYGSHEFDGKVDGKVLPVDSYYYIIEYNNGVKEASKGVVTIILNK